MSTKYTLKDGAPRELGECEIEVKRVKGKPSLLEVGELGSGKPAVLLEFYEGKLILRLYTNPSSTTPTFKSAIGEQELETADPDMPLQADLPIFDVVNVLDGI